MKNFTLRSKIDNTALPSVMIIMMIITIIIDIITILLFDQYGNAKHVLKAMQAKNEDKINHELISRGFIISTILKYSLPRTISLRSKARQTLAKAYSIFLSNA